MDYLEQIERIGRKTKLLLQKMEAVEKENQQLKQQLHALNAHLSEKEEKIHLLTDQIQALRLLSSNLNPEEKKELEKKISGYIREIDRCIALLSE